jgi:copper chaperone
VENALKELNGVHSINVELEKQQVTFAMDEALVDVSKVKDAIEDAGYDVV